ncbi:MAG TPA: DivIVA domain-containing protein [Candidatus Limnocylindrales bacterium]|nr:DivIVA domain-containing protein [Candidatus Limnocylindrales bacterium]
MTITPMDIQNKEFERSFRGYDIEDVDEFLDRVAKDIEKYIRENTDLKDQMEQLLEKNKSYRKLEETMHNAIVVAQEAAEDVKHNARREAELIRKEAEREAQRIIEDARYRSSRILVEQDELYKQAQVFRMRFRSVLEAQLSMLETEDWMDAPKPEKSLGTSRQDYQPRQDTESVSNIESTSSFEPANNFEVEPEL